MRRPRRRSLHWRDGTAQMVLCVCRRALRSRRHRGCLPGHLPDSGSEGSRDPSRRPLGPMASPAASRHEPGRLLTDGVGASRRFPGPLRQGRQAIQIGWNWQPSSMTKALGEIPLAANDVLPGRLRRVEQRIRRLIAAAPVPFRRQSTAVQSTHWPHSGFAIPANQQRAAS